MDSKVTKATPLRRTSKPSKNGESLASTARPFSAYGSTSAHPRPSYKKNSRQYGSLVEDRALKFFKQHSLKVLYRNKKIWGVEHDFIVLNSASEILFVEVKSLSRVEDLAWRVKPRQKQRLLRSAAAFMSNYPGKSRGLWLLALEQTASGHTKAHFLPLSGP